MPWFPHAGLPDPCSRTRRAPFVTHRALQRLATRSRDTPVMRGCVAPPGCRPRRARASSAALAASRSSRRSRPRARPPTAAPRPTAPSSQAPVTWSPSTERSPRPTRQRSRQHEASTKWLRPMRHSCRQLLDQRRFADARMPGQQEGLLGASGHSSKRRERGFKLLLASLAFGGNLTSRRTFSGDSPTCSSCALVPARSQPVLSAR
jgi:hypothetical protein